MQPCEFCASFMRLSFKERKPHSRSRVTVVNAASTSCRRAAATICPRPGLQVVTRYTSCTHVDIGHHFCMACWPASTTNQSGLVTLTFDLESGVRVTCDVGYLCANFGLPRPPRPDVRDRQTSDVRQHHRLMTPPRGRQHNKATVAEMLCDWEER